MTAPHQEGELIVEGLLGVEVVVGRRRAVGGDGGDLGGQHRETILESPHPADLIDGLASAGRDQPGPRPIGDPLGGPPSRRLEERVLGGVFGDGEVADVAHQRGNQPWPLRAEDVGDTHRIPQQTEPAALVSRRTP